MTALEEYELIFGLTGVRRRYTRSSTGASKRIPLRSPLQLSARRARGTARRNFCGTVGSKFDFVCRFLVVVVCLKQKVKS